MSDYAGDRSSTTSAARGGAQGRCSRPSAKKRAKTAGAPRGFAKALKATIAGRPLRVDRRDQEGVAQQGPDPPDFDPPSLAKAYERGGADLPRRS
jgi:indole-3-glycerol phosphate synthase